MKPWPAPAVDAAQRCFGRLRTGRAALACGLACWLLCGLARGELTATVDQTQLGPGDTLQLTLQTDRGGNGQPDLSPLKADFDILGRSSSSSLQIINGSVSSQHQLVLSLAPRHAGRIEIPPLVWDGERTAPIEISVAAQGQSGSGSGGVGSPVNGSLGTGAPAGSAHVFLTTSVDPPRPYVQAAVTVTVRVFSDEPLAQASLDLQGNAGVLVQRLGKDAQDRETRNGHDYQVVTRTYVVFPQRSGAIRLDGPVLDAQVADAGVDPFFGRAFANAFGQIHLPPGFGATRPLRLRGGPVDLQVRPRPAGMDSGDWLPARRLDLSASWQPATGGVPAGQPLSLHLQLTAVGLSAGQLPDLGSRLSLPPGLKAYPDQPRLVDQPQDGQIVGQRDQDIALLADHPGHYELPPLRLVWWDTAKDQRREVTLPARPIDILPGSGVAGAATPPTATPATSTLTPAPTPAAALPAAPAASARSPVPAAAAQLRPTAGGPATPWVWLSIGMGLLWLLTLAVLARRHWRRPGRTAVERTEPASRATPSIAARRREWQRACLAHAPRGARDAALAWARAAWPTGAPTGLHALGRRLGDARLTGLLRDLDRACVEGLAWDGTALSQALPQAPTREGSEGVLLPGLYGEPKG